MGGITKELSEQKKKEIAERAVKDIMSLAKLHNIPDWMITQNTGIREFLVSVYQAGATMALEECMNINITDKETANPDDVEF